MQRDQPCDVLIIGAGVAGCAAAVMLARQGRNVVLLERNLSEPDRIVGELLQPGGVAALEKLAMGECLEGIDAVPVKGYHTFYQGESVAFRYPLVDVPKHGVSGRGNGGIGGEEAEKRFEGRSFHHGRFVMKLREMARREGNVRIVEATAKELLKHEGSGRVVGVACLVGKERESQFYFAHLTIVANGQASNFRSPYIKHIPVTQSKFWGLELIDANLPSHGLAYGVMGSGPPTLIYQIGTRETRILIDIPNRTYGEASPKAGGVKAYIRAQVIPTLPKSVQPSVETALEHGRLRPMPNSWLPSGMNKTAGVALLGDAMDMRHPLSGSGMTVALNDVVLLRELLSPQNVPSLEDSRAVLAQMKRFHWKRKEFSTSLNILAQSLYCLMVADALTAAEAMGKSLRRLEQPYAQRGELYETVSPFRDVLENFKTYAGDGSGVTNVLEEVKGPLKKVQSL